MSKYMTHKSTAAGKLRTLRIKQARQMKMQGVILG